MHFDWKKGGVSGRPALPEEFPGVWRGSINFRRRDIADGGIVLKENPGAAGRAQRNRGSFGQIR